MLALITGAGSGIGEAFALQLASMNYDLILVGRNHERLTRVREKILASAITDYDAASATGSAMAASSTDSAAGSSTDSAAGSSTGSTAGSATGSTAGSATGSSAGSSADPQTQGCSTSITLLTADLADRDQCFELHRKITQDLHLQVDFLINNAGVGVYGKFLKTDLERELALIDINISAVHILTKLFLRDMEARGGGTILNVGSSAGFMAGPTFSSYYASKNYVVRLTEAIHEELRRAHSPVSISVLCPGPVRTDFNQKSDVHIPGEGLDPAYVAKLGIKGALQGKMVIVPGLFMKLGLFFSKHMSENLMTRVTYRVQIRKE